MTIAYIDQISDLTAYAVLGAMIDAGAVPNDIDEAVRRHTGIDIRVALSRSERSGESVIVTEMSGDATGIQLSQEDMPRFAAANSAMERLTQSWMEYWATRDDGALSTQQRLEFVAAIAAVECVELLGIDRIYATSLTIPRGLEAAPGELLKVAAGLPVQFVEHPLPASAVGIMTVIALVDQYSNPPPLTLRHVGCGASGQTDGGVQGLLRLSIGEIAPASDHPNEDTVMVVESNIDDMNPQNYGHVMDLLFEAGALDVTVTPVIMKKGRPGNLLSVLIDRPGLESVTSVILRETTTIGVRTHSVRRVILDRHIVEASTRFGTIRIKVVRHGTLVRFTPEYDDCREAARAFELPIAEVQQEARRVADNMDLDTLL